MKLKRPMYHSPPKGMTVGKDVEIAKHGVHRYRPALLPKPATGFTPHFGPALKDALIEIQRAEKIPRSGNIGQATWDVLWEELDDYRRWQYRLWKIPTVSTPSPVPDLGPVCIGDAALLLHSLTHNTDGPEPLRSWYPAVDTGWSAGRTVIAPERLQVTAQSGAAGGDAFYATGTSGLRYWFGHVASAPATGRIFGKGEKLGVIAWLSIEQGSPHLHVGIDARALIGGRLLYGRDGNGPDYTFGAPSIGTQLREALSL